MYFKGDLNFESVMKIRCIQKKTKIKIDTQKSLSKPTENIFKQSINEKFESVTGEKRRTILKIKPTIM